MKTDLAPEYRTPEGLQAEAILRKCVHCGFCTATCPTYQLYGDELDGPRGRIYLMKQVFEGVAPTRRTQLHLDRCLTCRNCETTCPSGVDYGRLIDIGRDAVNRKVRRPWRERLVRAALRAGLTSRWFAPALRIGQWVLPVLPAALRAKVPVAGKRSAIPVRLHTRKVLMLEGCVQPALMPNINDATRRVLDRGGVEVVVAPRAGCCGALRTHLDDHDGGLDDMRRNIDAWWPQVSSGEIEAIVSNASACGLALKEYGQALAHDPAYASRAARVSALARDVGELLPSMLPALRALRRGTQARAVAYHPSCTLQHGQKSRGSIEASLRELGLQLHKSRTEGHLCCGSAGTYSLLQPAAAQALRDRKLAQLEPLDGEVIVSNNIGCIQHLQSGSARPVRHWIEVLDDSLR
jgi:glycolate dehydrogenase iron-sulfur subunit